MYYRLTVTTPLLPPGERWAVYGCGLYLWLFSVRPFVFESGQTSEAPNRGSIRSKCNRNAGSYYPKPRNVRESRRRASRYQWTTSSLCSPRRHPPWSPLSPSAEAGPWPTTVGREGKETPTDTGSQELGFEETWDGPREGVSTEDLRSRRAVSSSGPFTPEVPVFIRGRPYPVFTWGFPRTPRRT